MPPKITPMMEQYLQFKEKHADCIVFFRLGDFYEMFHDDAIIAARELDITLTTRDRNKPKEDQVPMCGIPFHSAESYIARLVSKGYKIAICEQTQDASESKGLVQRDIQRVITPGTLMEDTMLEPQRNNFLASICYVPNGVGLCFCDVSTGQVSATTLWGEDCFHELCNEVSRFAPREAVVNHRAMEDHALLQFFKDRLDCRCDEGNDTCYIYEKAQSLSQEQFHEGLDTLPSGHEPAIQACGGLLAYLYATQKTNLSHLTTFSYYSRGSFMVLDITARRNLELTETLRSKEKRGSLLWVLDKTRTSMGGRLLRNWLERPLIDPIAISKRLDAVEELTQNTLMRQELNQSLRSITDLERIISRVVYGTANPRDLVSLSAGLGGIPTVQRLLAPSKTSLLQVLYNELNDFQELRHLLDTALCENPPFSVREGGFLQDGYHEEVDSLRNILKNGKSVVAALESDEREKTGIKNLKVSYNKVFGYYLEVSKSHYHLVPDTYIRKQTLTNCERYITQELKDMEHTILSAQEKINALEYQVFCQLRSQAADCVGTIQITAGAIAQIDVLTSLAVVAVENHYTKPHVDLSDVLEIIEGRHPVVEKVLKDSLFTPNNTYLDNHHHRAAIITGPNMAGKSTFMRQSALVALLAQMGSFVPAKGARVGIIDRIFTRVGASDDLTSGHSTFMVEMTEVAELLRNATSKSLLLLDEIGRGTSTYDGMSIARAVLEHCADKNRVGAKTLFATHYHELTCLEGQLSGIQNLHVTAKKKKDHVLFLRKVLPGAADQSYGIEVAQLAGVHPKVISRAKTILAELESNGLPTPTASTSEVQDQTSIQDTIGRQLIEQIRRIDFDSLTPMEALNLLHSFQKGLS